MFDTFCLETRELFKLCGPVVYLYVDKNKRSSRDRFVNLPGCENSEPIGQVAVKLKPSVKVNLVTGQLWRGIGHFPVNRPAYEGRVY